MGGRKGAKREALGNESVVPEPDETITRVVALRGSNQVEVENANGENLLCRMPAKFNKSIWVKRGSYVLVKIPEGDIDGKITGTLSRVLYAEQARQLQKTEFWPAGFRAQEEAKAAAAASASQTQEPPRAQNDKNDEDEEQSDGDEDGYYKLERNVNRQCSGVLYSSSDESDDE